VKNNSHPYAQHFLLTDFLHYLYTASSSGELKGQVCSCVCEELNSFLNHTCLKTDCSKKKRKGELASSQQTFLYKTTDDLLPQKTSRNKYKSCHVQ